MTGPTEVSWSLVARPRRRVVVLAVLTGAVLAVIWAVALQRLADERRHAVESVIARNDSLALAHAERAQRSLELMDLLLAQVTDAWLRERRLLTPEAAARPLRRDAVHVLEIGVIGADGHFVEASEAGAARGSVADRAYFLHHATRDDAEMFIGPPVQARPSGRWGVTLTRRLPDPSGAFAGLVGVLLDPAYLAAPFARAGNDNRDTVALVGLDGITRVRRRGGQMDEGSGASRLDTALFRALARAEAGHFEERPAEGGTRQLVSYRRLDHHALVAVVATDAEAVLADADARSRPALLAAVVASGLVMLLAAVIGAAAARRSRQLAALQASERRFRLLFEHSFDAILQTRPNGPIIGANPAACALFGMDLAALLGARREQLVDLTDPRLAALLAEREATGRASGLLRMRRADGSLFEAEIRATMYLDDEGREAVSMVIRDETARERVEAERQRAEARRRESQKLESIGTLAGGIAHDFNNILASILANAHLAASALADAQPGSATAPLRRIGQSAARARTLVQQILTFSRRSPEQCVPCDLERVVNEAVELLRPVLPATVSLAVKLPGRPAPVLGDATHLEQVIVNLCTNAWQAMPDQKGHIDLVLERLPDGAPPPGPGTWWRLRVRDDGAGMDTATRQHIFEPFFTTKPVGQGTGLGLPVVHGIVTAHGGQIEVDTAPGRGTTFDILLPGTAPPAEARCVPTADLGQGGPPAVPSRQDAPGAGRRVLYVDDDDVLALTVSALLQREGYLVETCRDPAAALARLKEAGASVQLLVTDQHMPGATGLELVAEVRRLRPDLPVVMTSGLVTEDLQAGARALGVSRIVMKEFTLEHLLPAVHAALAEAAPAVSPAAPAAGLPTPAPGPAPAPAPADPG